MPIGFSPIDGSSIASELLMLVSMPISPSCTATASVTVRASCSIICNPAINVKITEIAPPVSVVNSSAWQLVGADAIIIDDRYVQRNSEIMNVKSINFTYEGKTYPSFARVKKTSVSINKIRTARRRPVKVIAENIKISEIINEPYVLIDKFWIVDGGAPIVTLEEIKHGKDGNS